MTALSFTLVLNATQRDYTDHDGIQAQFVTAVLDGQLSDVLLLLKQGAVVMHEDENQLTPFDMLWNIDDEEIKDKILKALVMGALGQGCSWGGIPEWVREAFKPTEEIAAVLTKDEKKLRDLVEKDPDAFLQNLYSLVYFIYGECPFTASLTARLEQLRPGSCPKGPETSSSLLDQKIYPATLDDIHELIEQAVLKGASYAYSEFLVQPRCDYPVELVQLLQALKNAELSTGTGPQLLESRKKSSDGLCYLVLRKKYEEARALVTNNPYILFSSDAFAVAFNLGDYDLCAYFENTYIRLLCKSNQTYTLLKHLLTLRAKTRFSIEHELPQKIPFWSTFFIQMAQQLRSCSWQDLMLQDRTLIERYCDRLSLLAFQGAYETIKEELGNNTECLYTSTILGVAYALCDTELIELIEEAIEINLCQGDKDSFVALKRQFTANFEKLFGVELSKILTSAAVETAPVPVKFPEHVIQSLLGNDWDAVIDTGLDYLNVPIDDVRLGNNRGKTLLQYALQEGYSDVASVLIALGARLDTGDLQAACTSVCAALRARNSELLALLLKHGGSVDHTVLAVLFEVSPAEEKAPLVMSLAKHSKQEDMLNALVIYYKQARTTIPQEELLQQIRALVVNLVDEREDFASRQAVAQVLIEEIKTSVVQSDDRAESPVLLPQLDYSGKSLSSSSPVRAVNKPSLEMAILSKNKNLLVGLLEDGETIKASTLDLLLSVESGTQEDALLQAFAQHADRRQLKIALARQQKQCVQKSSSMAPPERTKRRTSILWMLVDPDARFDHAHPLLNMIIDDGDVVALLDAATDEVIGHAFEIATRLNRQETIQAMAEALSNVPRLARIDLSPALGIACDLLEVADSDEYETLLYDYLNRLVLQQAQLNRITRLQQPMLQMPNAFPSSFGHHS